MAKQLVSPVERHVEKAILGIAVLALGAVVTLYVVSTPNRIEMGNQTVTPATIDQAILAKGEEVRQRIRSASMDVAVPEPLYDAFVTKLDPFSDTNLASPVASAVQIGPIVPLIDAPDTKLGESELVKVVQMPPPELTSGRSIFVTYEFETQDPTYFECNWVTASTLFDRAEQVKRQIKSYGARRKDVIYGPVELQRRELRGDGSWSEDDWVDVEVYPKPSVRPAPEFEFVTEEGVVKVPSKMRTELDEYQKRLQEDTLTQLSYLRPLMAEVDTGDAWRFPIISTYKDVIWQDDEFLYPKEKSEVPDDRYGLAVVEETVEEELPKSQQLDKMLNEATMLIARADESKDEELATVAYNKAFDVDGDTEASPQQKAKAAELMRNAEQARRDIKRWKRRNASRPAQQDDEEDLERERSDVQQIWAHDASPDSIKSGSTYQYRIRISLFNRLLGEPGMLLNPEDAKTVFIAGPWSEPSEPISFEPKAYYFATAVDRRKNEAKVDIYQWFEGHWVTKRFAIPVGSVVAGKGRCEIPDKDDPTVIDRPQVEFDVGVSVVDIIPDRPYRDRKEKRGGVKFDSSLGNEPSVVFVDSSGRLYERIVPVDKNNPARKLIADRVGNTKSR